MSGFRDIDYITMQQPPGLGKPSRLTAKTLSSPDRESTNICELIEAIARRRVNRHAPMAWSTVSKTDRVAASRHHRLPQRRSTARRYISRCNGDVNHRVLTFHLVMYVFCHPGKMSLRGTHGTAVARGASNNRRWREGTRHEKRSC